MDKAKWNRYNSSVEELQLVERSQEVQDTFWEFIESVPYIQRLIDPGRKRAKDLPRDEEGKIIVDVTRPHILEGMDYFRPAAIHYQETGSFCDFRPNPNPNSDFMKWQQEEIRRCLDGYVRQSDGEWITGDHYFFLNYFPIEQNKRIESGRRRAVRFTDFPKIWEGHYLWFHYMQNARELGMHACQFASRQKGKSYSLASMLLKRLIIGETSDMTKDVQSIITASQEDYLKTAKRVLPMFMKGLEFTRANTQFRHSLLRESLNDMTWEAGYIDNERGRIGSHNTVTGVSSANAAKLRGARATLVAYDEIGSFPSLLDAYNKNLYLVEDGENVFGQQVLVGTAGDKDSDFASIQEIMYSPDGYNMYNIDNVYDREGLGKKKFVYFFPAYMNYTNSYDKDGNSDVTKALLSLIEKREQIKRTSTDPSTLVSLMAENPIVPQEAILKTLNNKFPVTAINNRIAELDANPNEYDDVWTGTLVLDSHGVASFKPTGDRPIHDYPLKDTNRLGALEIFSTPQTTADGRVTPGRYIVGFDPVDDDEAQNSTSLASIFVLDLFNDNIVAEYTGRGDAEHNYEILRLICIYYNATCMYESNIKGTFAYFSRMNCLHLLADTPQYLIDKQIIKVQSEGLNKTKGVRATMPINRFADELTIKWLSTPTTAMRLNENGIMEEISITNLNKVRNRAFLKEMSLYTPAANCDRLRAFGMLMLYREEKMIISGGDLSLLDRTRHNPSNAENDPYFSKFDKKFRKNDFIPDEFKSVL